MRSYSVNSLSFETFVKFIEMVSVAQLVRAPDCGSGGWGFKSPHSPSQCNFAPVAQLDRAPGFEPVGCVFESRRARCPASSIWQSNGFLIRGLEVQVLCGVL